MVEPPCATFSPALAWRAASIPDIAWPHLLLRAAKDFELNRMGANSMGGVAATAAVCAPRQSCEKSPQLHELQKLDSERYWGSYFMGFLLQA